MAAVLSDPMFLIGVQAACDCLNAIPVEEPRLAFFQILLAVGFQILSLLLRRPQRPPPVDIPDQDVPETDAGEQIIDIYGTETFVGHVVFSEERDQVGIFESTSKKG